METSVLPASSCPNSALAAALAAILRIGRRSSRKRGRGWVFETLRIPVMKAPDLGLSMGGRRFGEGTLSCGRRTEGTRNASIRILRPCQTAAMSPETPRVQLCSSADGLPGPRESISSLTEWRSSLVPCVSRQFSGRICSTGRNRLGDFSYRHRLRVWRCTGGILLGTWCCPRGGARRAWFANRKTWRVSQDRTGPGRIPTA
jgi:hypothetical protein